MSSHLTAREAEHERAVKAMFTGIAGRYDLLNHLLSLNIDKLWRRRVKRILSDTIAHRHAVVLDIACGTGDLSIELASGTNASIIGTDFCRPMLAIAHGKAAKGGKPLPFIESDAMSLSFPDNSFDAATIAFGLRNLPNFENGLREMFRVIKPGGRMVILEFSSPVVPGFRQAFNFYFLKVLPRIGGLVSGSRSAYEYLPNSVQKFPDQKALAAMMTSIGYTSVTYQNLTGGIAAIHVGTKPTVS